MLVHRVRTEHPNTFSGTSGTVTSPVMPSGHKAGSQIHGFAAAGGYTGEHCGLPEWARDPNRGRPPDDFGAS